MLSRNISLKTKQTYNNKTKPENEFTLSVTIQTNHQLDVNALHLLENQIKNILVTDYNLEKEEPKKNAKQFHYKQLSFIYA